MEDLEEYDASQDLFSETWRGLSLKSIHRMEKVPGNQSTSSPKSDRWDEYHVRMPFSKECLQPVNTNSIDGLKELKSKWVLIEEALAKPITCGSELEEVIFHYNLSGRWNFDGLIAFLEDNDHLSEIETQYFLDNVLVGIKKLCLQLPKVLNFPLVLLRKQDNASVTLSQTQVSSLLANAFFCTFPRRNATSKKSEYHNFPDINFSRLYEPFSGPQHPHKLKCIFNYFRRRISTNASDGLITFSRRALSHDLFPNWRTSTKPLPRLHISSDGNIENDGHGLFQVDFANAMIGGGVLGFGCVQEEIRFLICPELIISRLFVERLEDNECLVISGFERYSDYRGYASTFEFLGNYEDQTLFDITNNHRKSVLVAIDALKFKDSHKQFTEKNILREINKAYVGFYYDEKASSKSPGIATGNWGCGAFGGDPHLKALIQLMAAGEAGQRDLAYFTFGDESLRDSIYNTYQNLIRLNVTIGSLYSQILKYCSFTNNSETDLLEYLNESFNILN
uniref:poly(ADP-ribose) glycohydrolase n=1 Tax=Lepeophtheirus salmonis TaxID=72036 RepID=A0A0K2UVC4_LEPSM